MVRKDGSVALVVLVGDHPLNILDRETLINLFRLLTELSLDAKLTALVVTGGGKKAFSAGANLSELAQLTPETAQQLSQLGQNVTSLIFNFPCPVIAAIGGICFGGGLELAIAADFRLAGDDATFAYPAARLGILPGFGGTQRCPALLGPARTKELMFLGRILDAQTAHDWGLLHEVVAPAELQPTALHWARELGARDRHAIGQMKACVNRTAKEDFLYEQKAFAACFRQPGVKQKLQKWQQAASLTPNP
jgi:enoyl-CoA hydratase